MYMYSDCLGCAVFPCLVCLFDLACFFLPSFSHLSLKHVFSLLIDAQDVEQQSCYMFHGTVHNRWFDKCINLSVATSAVMGANVEHSALDATVSRCG